MKKIIIIVLVVLVLGLVAYFIIKSRQNVATVPVTNQSENTVPAEQNLKTDIQPVANPDMPNQTRTVTIENFAFSPANLTINQGDTVVWVNNDSAPHAISGDGFESSSFGNGQDYNHKFASTGTFNYKCSIHPSMKGTITVK